MEAAVYRQREANLAYGNETGLQLLTELDTNKSDIERLKEQVEAVTKEGKDTKNEVGNLKDEISDLRETLSELSIQSEGYRQIRNRFLEIFKRDEAADNRVINSGNAAAHHGEAVTDAFLYERGMRTDARTLKNIYGLGYADIIVCSRHGDRDTISVINRRATMFVRDGVPEKVEQAHEEYFEELDNPQELEDKQASTVVCYVLAGVQQCEGMMGPLLLLSL
ncbi:hypothetical protein FQN51_008436 [Onygenales sp. PD_10]|nr:hypothetical protein FQN51_008436 [Onygenales sp. PD_10]